MLAMLGWHTTGDREIFSLDELIDSFSLERVSKSGAKFDVEKAKWFNHKYIQLRDKAELAELITPQLKTLGIETTNEYLTQVVGLMKEKVNFINEILVQGMYFFNAPTGYDEQVASKKWTAEVAKTLREYGNAIEELDIFNSTNLETLLSAVAQINDMKTGQLMQPLRISVSGVASGPPIFEMLALLGKDEVRSRMNKALNTIAVVQA